MKIKDLYENNEDQFKNRLRTDIMDVLMMFRKNQSTRVDIVNLVSELDKAGYSASYDEVKEIVNELPDISIEEVDDREFLIFGDDSTEMDDSEFETDPTVEPEDEHNPARSKARQATQKRLKDMI